MEWKKSWFILFYWQRSEGKQCYKSYTAGFQGVTLPENVIFFWGQKIFEDFNVIRTNYKKAIVRVKIQFLDSKRKASRGEIEDPNLGEFQL